MSLVANRVESRRLSDFKQPGEFGIGLGDTYLEQHIYDHPKPAITLIIKEVKWATNKNGQLAYKEIDEWDYDEVTRCPRTHHKWIWALLWLPMLTSRESLVLVETQETVYTYAGYLIGGPMDHRMVREGYVIYDTYPRAVDLKPSEIAALQKQGRRVTYGGTGYKKVVDSARDWRSAMDASGIVEKKTAKQVCDWVPISEERVWVEDDTQKVVTWTLTQSFIKGGLPSLTRTEQLKEPEKWELPFTVLAPAIKAWDADGNPTVPIADAKGVAVEIKGGGGTTVDVDADWEQFLQKYPPDKYVVFRKTLVAPERTFTNDPLGMRVSPEPYAGSGMARPLEATAVTDFEGTPASALPAPEGYSETEDPTPPVPESWTQVGEAANAEKVKDLPGRAMFFDKTVEHGAKYEYYAVAVVGTQESEASNHEIVQYEGPLGMSTNPSDLEVLGPPLPDVPDDYGETVSLDVPTPDDVAADVALRQFMQNGQNERIKVGQREVMLNLERGQLTKLPEASWKTSGIGLLTSSKVKPEVFTLEGFGFTASRDDMGAFALSVDPLIVKVP